MAAYQTRIGFGRIIIVGTRMGGRRSPASTDGAGNGRLFGRCFSGSAGSIDCALIPQA
ncbi:hypothetical protein [Stenotrophomonas maltophilia]|uniref:hypothetical protein n=1 Tax=Stenotrophomonas maltophilia TaxID=40324 RepID=UPI000AB01428|nr:hypothetical protein [Stenotrophomonas maltophilia]